MEKLDAVVFSAFIDSGMRGSFNGIRAEQALAMCGYAADDREPILALTAAGRIDCVFERSQGNPHIRRLPPLDVAKQIEWAAGEPLATFCLYPTADVLRENIGPEVYRNEPFSRALMLGEAQLRYVAFDLAVLGRYRADPRYRLTFEDYVGQMSISNDAYEDVSVLERDKISVQSFGLGLDEEAIPCIVAFYRYLANLTPEHQQYWNSFAAARPVQMCDPYYRSAIVGEFWNNRSVRNAISVEMRLINELAEKVAGRPLFRQLLTKELPFDLSAFLVPSSENYDHFVHAWDKLLSDNLSKGFFAGLVPLEREEKRSDGRIVVVPKGTLALLREWLGTSLAVRGANEVIERIMAPLEQVRKERQGPAHRFAANRFSKDFHEQRRATLWSIFECLTTLRDAMTAMPGAEGIAAPDWLDGEIDVL